MAGILRSFSRALALAVLPSSALASVSFQNEGTLTGWSNYPQNPCCGTISSTSSPTYQGSQAIRFYQKFNGFGSYHNEVTRTPVAPVGSDTYMGFALYLPSTWVYHNQSVVFSQWARSDSSNTPWTLMYVQNQEIRTGGSGGLQNLWMSGFTKAAWHTFVVRIRNSTTNGILEVWIDGVNRGRHAKTNISPGGPSIRWSMGQYCTYWRENLPLHDPVVSHMDHFRVATTYAEAEPANWGGSSPTPTPAPTSTPSPTSTPNPTATPTPDPTPTPTVGPTPTPGGTFSGYYRIMARHSGKAVVVQSASTSNAANVIQWTYGGANTNDEWEARSIGSGYYRLINRHSGKDLTVESASTAEGANIFQYTYGGANTNDEWTIVSVGSGYHRITNRNSAKSAEVAGGGTGDGADVVQRTYSGATHQQFQLVSVP